MAVLPSLTNRQILQAGSMLVRSRASIEKEFCSLTADVGTLGCGFTTCD